MATPDVQRNRRVRQQPHHCRENESPRRHCRGRQTHPSISGRRDNYEDCRTCHNGNGIVNNYCKSSMLIQYVPSHISSKEGRDNINSVVSSLVHMINFVNNIFNFREINFRILPASIVSLIIV